jgi:hypothetical protein
MRGVVIGTVRTAVVCGTRSFIGHPARRSTVYYGSGTSDGRVVGTTVGGAVGTRVGTAVGDCVGLSLGANVGNAVGAVVGRALGVAVGACCAGNSLE